MASWIIHLRIAENLLGWIPNLNAEKFALGSVAPDPGIFDEITHFDTARIIHNINWILPTWRPRQTKDTGLIPFDRLFLPFDHG